MIVYDKEKHIATLKMTDALTASHRAYFADPTELNKAAMQACEAAMREMLIPYCMVEKEKHEPNND